MVAAASPAPDDYGLPRSPAARKVLPLVPQILAEGWSSITLAKKTGIAESTAKRYLATIQDSLRRNSALTAAAVQQKAGEVALRVRNRQIERAERVESEIEAVLEQIDKGFLKTHWDSKAGAFVEKRYQYDASEKARILGEILRGDKTLDDILRSLSGRDLAEKALLARVKGEALGKGIAEGLIDSTASELGQEIWDIEAETLPD